MATRRTPQVTVVIPTRNRWPMLRSALWSALSQEDVATRAIVVNDASTDETAERLSQIADERLSVVHLPRAVGVSAARNRGLADADGEWVTFLDDDDVWAPSHLASLLRAAAEKEERGARVDLAFSGSVEITPDRTVTDLKHASDVGVSEYIFSWNVFATPSRVLLRTEAARRLGGFDEELSITADWDLWLRFVNERGEVAASPELSVGYTLHGENMHLDAGRARNELAILEDRYGHAVEDRQYSFTDRCARWIAASYRVAGRRAPAVRWYLKSYRCERDGRDLGRAAGVLLGERAIRRFGLGWPPDVPPGIAPWLNAIREIDQLPAHELPFPIRVAVSDG